MTHKAYLTIDDSVTDETPILVDYLCEHNIPAILFCRGDRLFENKRGAIYAAERGLVLANHAYNHQRSSLVGFDVMADEIARTEDLIDAIYIEAGIQRGARYFRFPHMDRGCGGWIVDYDAYPQYRDILISLFADGLNISLEKPSDEQIRLKDDLQNFLKQNGFSKLKSDGIKFPWFTETEMASAMDAMFTFSTSDWMVGPRHRGKWPLKSEDDLIARMKASKSLNDESSASIILIHDQPGLFQSVKPLLDHLRAENYQFLPF